MDGLEEWVNGGVKAEEGGEKYEGGLQCAGCRRRLKELLHLLIV